MNLIRPRSMLFIGAVALFLVVSLVFTPDQPRKSAGFWIWIAICGTMEIGLLWGFWGFIAGRKIYHRRILLPVPAEQELHITASSAIPAAALLISFKHNMRRYFGSIVITQVTNGKAQLLDEIKFKGIKPSLSFRVPRWLPVSDAGQVLRMWPAALQDRWEVIERKLRKPFQSGSILVVRFELELNELAIKELCGSKVPTEEEVEIELRTRR